MLVLLYTDIDEDDDHEAGPANPASSLSISEGKDVSNAEQPAEQPAEPEEPATKKQRPNARGSFKRPGRTNAHRTGA